MAFWDWINYLNLNNKLINLTAMKGFNNWTIPYWFGPNLNIIYCVRNKYILHHQGISQFESYFWWDRLKTIINSARCNKLSNFRFKIKLIKKLANMWLKIVIVIIIIKISYSHLGQFLKMYKATMFFILSLLLVESYSIFCSAYCKPNSCTGISKN